MDTIHFLSEDRQFLKRPDRDHFPLVKMVPPENSIFRKNSVRDRKYVL